MVSILVGGACPTTPLLWVVGLSHTREDYPYLPCRWKLGYTFSK